MSPSDVKYALVIYRLVAHGSFREFSVGTKTVSHESSIDTFDIVYILPSSNNNT